MKSFAAIVATLLIVVTLATIGRSHSGDRGPVGVLHFPSGSTLTSGGGEDNFVITNSGASGATVINLPDAVAGLHYTFVVATAQDLDINPQNGDTISPTCNAAGDALSSDATVGSFVEVVAISDSTWMVLSKTGTWSDAN